MDIPPTVGHDENFAHGGVNPHKKSPATGLKLNDSFRNINSQVDIGSKQSDKCVIQKQGLGLHSTKRVVLNTSISIFEDKKASSTEFQERLNESLPKISNSPNYGGDGNTIDNTSFDLLDNLEVSSSNSVNNETINTFFLNNDSNSFSTNDKVETINEQNSNLHANDFMKALSTSPSDSTEEHSFHVNSPSPLSSISNSPAPRSYLDSREVLNGVATSSDYTEFPQQQSMNKAHTSSHVTILAPPQETHEEPKKIVKSVTLGSEIQLSPNFNTSISPYSLDNTQVSDNCFVQNHAGRTPFTTQRANVDYKSELEDSHILHIRQHFNRVLPVPTARTLSNQANFNLRDNIDDMNMNMNESAITAKSTSFVLSSPNININKVLLPQSAEKFIGRENDFDQKSPILLAEQFNKISHDSPDLHFSSSENESSPSSSSFSLTDRLVSHSYDSKKPKRKPLTSISHANFNSTSSTFGAVQPQPQVGVASTTVKGVVSPVKPAPIVASEGKVLVSVKSFSAEVSKPSSPRLDSNKRSSSVPPAFRFQKNKAIVQAEDDNEGDNKSVASNKTLTLQQRLRRKEFHDNQQISPPAKLGNRHTTVDKQNIFLRPPNPTSTSIPVPTVMRTVSSSPATVDKSDGSSFRTRSSNNRQYSGESINSGYLGDCASKSTIFSPPDNISTTAIIDSNESFDQASIFTIKTPRYPVNNNTINARGKAVPMADFSPMYGVSKYIPRLKSKDVYNALPACEWPTGTAVAYGPKLSPPGCAKTGAGAERLLLHRGEFDGKRNLDAYYDNNRQELVVLKRGDTCTYGELNSVTSDLTSVTTHCHNIAANISVTNSNHSMDNKFHNTAAAFALAPSGDVDVEYDLHEDSMDVQVAELMEVINRHNVSVSTALKDDLMNGLGLGLSSSLIKANTEYRSAPAINVLRAKRITAKNFYDDEEEDEMMTKEDSANVLPPSAACAVPLSRVLGGVDANNCSSVTSSLSDFSRFNPYNNFIEGGDNVVHQRFDVAAVSRRASSDDIVRSTGIVRNKFPFVNANNIDIEEFSSYGPSLNTNTNTCITNQAITSETIISRQDKTKQVEVEEEGSSFVEAPGNYPHNDLDASGCFTSATTVTFDTGNEGVLKVESKTRRLYNLNETMKEISIRCEVGSYNTVALTIKNSRSTLLVAYPSAIQMRFDSQSQMITSEQQANTDLINSFQISPHKLRIHPGEESSFYVTFTPKSEIAGIYSGAVKIKFKNKKTHVFLLRGESVPPCLQEEECVMQQEQQQQQLSVMKEEIHLDTPEFSSDRYTTTSADCAFVASTNSNSHNEDEDGLGSIQLSSVSSKEQSYVHDTVRTPSALARASSAQSSLNTTEVVDAIISVNEIAETCVNQYYQIEERYRSEEVMNDIVSRAILENTSKQLDPLVKKADFLKKYIRRLAGCGKDLSQMSIHDEYHYRRREVEQEVEEGEGDGDEDEDTNEFTSSTILSPELKTVQPHRDDPSHIMSPLPLLYVPSNPHPIAQPPIPPATASFHEADFFAGSTILSSPVNPKATHANLHEYNNNRNNIHNTNMRSNNNHTNNHYNNNATIYESLTVEPESIFLETSAYANKLSTGEMTASSLEGYVTLQNTGSTSLSAEMTTYSHCQTSTLKLSRNKVSIPPKSEFRLRVLCNYSSSFDRVVDASASLPLEVGFVSMRCSDGLEIVVPVRMQCPVRVVKDTSTRKSSSLQEEEEGATPVVNRVYSAGSVHMAGIMNKVLAPAYEHSKTQKDSFSSNLYVPSSDSIMTTSTSTSIARERDSTYEHIQNSTFYTHRLNESSATQGLSKSTSNKRPTGVFFRRDIVQFNSISVGSLTRARVELCNATDTEVTVLLGDPSLPFVLLHNEIKLRARSYVRIPVRFVPVSLGEFVVELVAQTSDGSYHTNILLQGTSH